MKQLILFMACALMLWLPGTVQAQDRTFYFGLKGGWMFPDVSALDEAFNGGLLAGGFIYEDPATGSIAIEGEVTTSFSDGDVSFLGMRGEWDLDTIALYGVFRSPGQIYFKGKIGILYEDASVTISGTGASGDDTGLSAGIGAGWMVWDRGSLELEYTIIEEDVDFLSLSYNFYF